MMSNLEKTLLCALAMGYKSVRVGSDRGPDKQPFDTVWVAADATADHSIYGVLSGLMCKLAVVALIEKFHLMLTPVHMPPGILWTVCRHNGDWHGEDALLSFAVAECVARGQLKDMSSRVDTSGAKNGR